MEQEKVNEPKGALGFTQAELEQQMAEALKEMAKRDPKQYKKIMLEHFPETVLVDELHKPRQKPTRNQRRIMKKQGLL